jgi:hypothetical protein
MAGLVPAVAAAFRFWLVAGLREAKSENAAQAALTSRMSRRFALRALRPDRTMRQLVSSLHRQLRHRQ